MLLKNGLSKPFIAMSSPSSGIGPSSGTLFNKATQDAFWFYLKAAAHEAFTDNPWILNPSATTRRQALTLDRCVVAFFNRYLSGVDDHFLDAPGADYPDITSFKRK
jgi:hypothetical protein